MKGSLVFILTLLSTVLSSQISFSVLQSPTTRAFRSGAPVVAIDMNGDCHDDLIRLHNIKVLQIDLQSADGSFLDVHRQSITNLEQWNLVAGDLDGDGWPDIATSGIGPVKLIRAAANSYDFAISEIADNNFFAQGSNIVDANGDGHQDLFVCNDNGYNRLYINDGSGNFERNDTLIDFNTVPASDNSGNYGSVWTDFDLDNDLDLYISKCRAGVFDPSDPRRINVLYVNTDSGYVEMADSFGLADGGQSWAADFADIDNDGDFDILIVNHDMPSQLLENRGGGNYVDIASQAGLNISGLILQSIFRDFDNDGYVDLLISGIYSRLYRNLGDNTFEEVASPFGNAFITSFTIGDFNNDGFPDVYATYNNPYNTPSNTTDDAIWLNDGNDHHYVRIKAVGTDGNSSAIGAKLLLYSDTITQLREIRAGESYGIGTSLIKNFGLGDSSLVDSLVVIWANGDTQTHYSITIDTTLTVRQAGCLKPVVALSQGPFIQCGQDTFTISAPAGFQSYLWSNGMTSQSIDVSEPGLYHVYLTDSSGCWQVSSPVTIKPCVWPSEVVYVDSSAIGANTGVDWENAFTDLQLALDVADSFFINIEQVWVARGTYFPTVGTDRTESFVLVEDIEIYGGFEGSETKVSGRNVALNPTKLSGDIGIASDSTDNSYHVVVCPDSISAVKLDGFTIQDGNADGGAPMHTQGAGLYCQGKFSLLNTILQDCSATGEGKYIFNSGSDAVLRLLNCQLPETGVDGVLNVGGAELIVERETLIQN